MLRSRVIEALVTGRPPVMRATLHALLALASLAGRPSLAHAQRSCLAVPARARDKITDFLHNPMEEAWRRALAITDTSADHLRALVDARDAKLCRCIRAALDIGSPVYLLWARNHVIAVADPSRDPVTGQRTDGEWSVSLWILDRWGNEVHAEGDGALPAPLDLHGTLVQTDTSDVRQVMTAVLTTGRGVIVHSDPKGAPRALIVDMATVASSAKRAGWTADTLQLKTMLGQRDRTGAEKDAIVCTRGHSPCHVSGDAVYVRVRRLTTSKARPVAYVDYLTTDRRGPNRSATCTWPVRMSFKRVEGRFAIDSLTPPRQC